MQTSDDKLDRPIYGARPIGQAANIVDNKGKVDVRKTFYALEQGYIDANKFGRRWVTTLRRIRAGYVGASK
jgi:hypothetical protein